MTELEQILRAQAERYPKMEPTDAVKLIYQNEFGGGHLIRDEEGCLRYLRREYALVKRDTAVPRCESIGNGIIRVNLAAVLPEELEQLGADFIHSAAAHTGTIDSFREKLSVLKTLTAGGTFRFTAVELDAYLAEYEKAGYPPVSHSESYRAAYRPAYRVILEREA